jgi:hypothetical protein
VANHSCAVFCHPAIHPCPCTEAFPSPYQLHYNRPLPPAAALTGRLEALAKHNSWAQPHGFAPISPGEVGDMLQRWGLGWEVPPHVQGEQQQHSALTPPPAWVFTLMIPRHE